MSTNPKPMSARKLKALRASIAIWEKRATGETESECPLCVLYRIGRTRLDRCHGCPVFAATGQKYCEGTPYEEWIDVDIRAEREAAKRELRFLRSLLPKGER